jgi:hypothetical protein
MIVELEDPTEAFVLSKQVLEAFVFPTLSEEGQKTLTENLAGSVEAAFANPDVSTYGVRANQALVGYAAVGKNSHISQLVSLGKKAKVINNFIRNFYKVDYMSLSRQGRSSNFMFDAFWKQMHKNMGRNASADSV